MIESSWWGGAKSIHWIASRVPPAAWSQPTLRSIWDMGSRCTVAYKFQASRGRSHWSTEDTAWLVCRGEQHASRRRVPILGIEKHSCGLQSNSDGRRFFGFYRWLMEALKQIVGEHLTRIHPVMEKNGWDISIHMIFCLFDWPILMGYALSYNKRLGSAMSHHTQRQRGSRLRKSTVVSVTPFILLLRIWLSNGILLIYLMSLHRENDNATSSKTNITQNCWRLWQNTIHIIRFIWRPNSETITSRSHYWGRNSWLLCSSANTCVSAAVTFVACNISSISSECAAVFTTCSSVAILQEIWGTKLMNIIKYVHKYQMMQYNIKVT